MSRFLLNFFPIGALQEEGPCVQFDLRYSSRLSARQGCCDIRFIDVIYDNRCMNTCKHLPIRLSLYNFLTLLGTFHYRMHGKIVCIFFLKLGLGRFCKLKSKETGKSKTQSYDFKSWHNNLNHRPGTYPELLWRGFTQVNFNVARLNLKTIIYHSYGNA